MKRDGSGRRLDWLDTFRGVTIIFVVAGHVLGGIQATPGVERSSYVQSIYDWIYLFHMPAFFWASGLFVERTYCRQGPRDFIVNKAATLLYPYFLWGVLGWLIHQAAGQYANTQPGDATGLVKLLWLPNSGPWFLFVLFELMLLTALFRLIGFGWLVRAGIMALAWIAWARYAPSLPQAISLPARFGIYFALGEGTFAFADRLAKNVNPWWVGIGGLGAFALDGAAIGSGFEINRAISPLFALFGTLGLLGVSLCLNQISVYGWLRVCGRHSLEIYLMHPYPSVFARVLLVKALSISTWPIHVLAGTVAGVLFALLGALAFRYLHWDFLFRAPWPKEPSKAIPISETTDRCSTAIEASFLSEINPELKTATES